MSSTAATTPRRSARHASTAKPPKKVGKSKNKPAARAQQRRSVLGSIVAHVGSLLRDDDEPLAVTGSLGLIGSLFASEEQQAADIVRMLERQQQQQHQRGGIGAPQPRPTRSALPAPAARDAVANDDDSNSDKDASSSSESDAE